jgi:hypothetical protein
MSIPKPPKPAKLVVGFFLRDKALTEKVVRDLQGALGAIDMVSPWLDFDFTSYYEKEMGGPLYRRLVAFKPLVEQSELAAIKRVTNDLEKKYEKEGGLRRINIDPGYLLAERFVLATGKNFTHRIYIGDKIYADLTLIFQKGAFRKLPWTYPDYADRRIIAFLTLVRDKYMRDLNRIRNCNEIARPVSEGFVKSPRSRLASSEEWGLHGVRCSDEG